MLNVSKLDVKYQPGIGSAAESVQGSGFGAGQAVAGGGSHLKLKLFFSTTVMAQILSLSGIQIVVSSF